MFQGRVRICSVSGTQEENKATTKATAIFCRFAPAFGRVVLGCGAAVTRD